MMEIIWVHIAARRRRISLWNAPGRSRLIRVYGHYKRSGILAQNTIKMVLQCYLPGSTFIYHIKLKFFFIILLTPWKINLSPKGGALITAYRIQMVAGNDAGWLMISSKIHNR